MSKNSFDVNLIGLRINHHAGASGYDQLISKLDAHSIATKKELNFAQKVLVKILNRLIKNSGSTWYHRYHFITELSLIKHWLMGKGQVFHFLYGENSYRYAGLLKLLGRNNFLVSTYHTPTVRFREVVTARKFISRLDAIIVVSTIQQEFFAELVGADKVFFVPHGIDIEFFKPVSKKSGADEIFRCICVGGHLRDHETLLRAANYLSGKIENLKITVVAPPSYHDQLSNCVNIEFYSGVSDEHLLSLYRSADLLLLPLLDCTANNALLEGMACGLPVVTTDLQGARDYANEECAIFVEKGNSQALADAVIEIISDEERLKQMGEHSREQSKKFEWKHVVNQLESIYSQIAN
jgi:glycosyltransferase involved in cell wall biosynthesis